MKVTWYTEQEARTHLCGPPTHTLLRTCMWTHCATLRGYRHMNTNTHMTFAASLYKTASSSSAHRSQGWRSALPWQVQIGLYKYRRVIVAIAGGSYPTVLNIEEMLQVDHAVLDKKQSTPIFPISILLWTERFYMNTTGDSCMFRANCVLLSEF